MRTKFVMRANKFLKNGVLSLTASSYHFLVTLRYTSIAINDNTKTAHITPEVIAMITTISNDSENKTIAHSNGALRIVS